MSAAPGGLEKGRNDQIGGNTVHCDQQGDVRQAHRLSRDSDMIKALLTINTGLVTQGVL